MRTMRTTSIIGIALLLWLLGAAGPAAAQDEAGAGSAPSFDLAVMEAPRGTTLDDIVNHTVGRLLDLFGIETGVVKRWQGGPPEGE